MGKVGEKQKRRPKITDKRQSERFKETAREVGADEPGEAFDRIVDQMAHPEKNLTDKTRSLFFPREFLEGNKNNIS